MKKLILQSKQIIAPVQEYTPDKECEYVQLMAYTASPRLVRIRQRADEIRQAEYERLIAL